MHPRTDLRFLSPVLLGLPLFTKSISGYFRGHALLIEGAELALVIHLDELLTAGGGEGDVQLHLDTAERLGGVTKKRPDFRLTQGT